MIYKQFYSEIGKLLYAVANADGVITEKEKQTLLKIVKKELVPAEDHRDTFGTNAAFFAEFEFEFMDEVIASPEDALGSFIDFIEEHRTAIDERLKNVCLQIAVELATAYYGINRKEKEKIDKLIAALNKIELADNRIKHKKRRRIRISQ